MKYSIVTRIYTEILINQAVDNFTSSRFRESRLYGEPAGKYNRLGEDDRVWEHGKEESRTEKLKEIICKKLQQSMKALLSYEQLERFQEEFIKATQGLVIREA